MKNQFLIVAPILAAQRWVRKNGISQGDVYIIRHPEELMGLSRDRCVIEFEGYPHNKKNNRRA